MSKPRKHLPCYHCGRHVETSFDALRCTCAPCTTQGKTLPQHEPHHARPTAQGNLQFGNGPELTFAGAVRVHGGFNSGPEGANQS